MSDQISLDTKSAIERLGGNKRLYMKVLQSVLTDPAVQKNTLENLLAAGSMKDAERLVHTVKGFGGSIGADGLYQIGAQLEKLCHDQEVDMNSEVFIRFQKELEDTLAAVRRYLAEEE